MDQNTLIIIGTIISGFIGLALFLSKKQEGGADDKGMLLLQQQLNQLSEQFSKTNSDMSRTIQDQFKSSTGIIRDVTEKLTKLEDTNKQVVSIADQLQGLENVLKNPKQRGILGEYYLETLLKNLFT
ncbi:DNA recombination protein RmuC, partial [bacterium (Candidatus Howlettbacteria) CG_4_10_14_0_8_um_filter_40_9]